MDDVMANTILNELREFRAENNKRWEENDRRWEENDRRWEENDRRWEENDRRWEQNDERWKLNDEHWRENAKILSQMNNRIVALEEGRKKDRKEIIDILDTMQKSIDNQFSQMREYFDAKFEKVYAAQRVYEVENNQFKKILYAHEKRINFHSSRLNYLEEWQDKFDMGEFAVV